MFVFFALVSIKQTKKLHGEVKMRFAKQEKKNKKKEKKNRKE